jgi:hypothetical protein
MVRTVTCDTCGNDLTDKQVLSFFDQVDMSGDGAIDRDEFEAKVDTLRRRLSAARVPPPPVLAKPKALGSDAACGIDASIATNSRSNTIRRLSRAFQGKRGGELENWNVLYCGGGAAVVAELKKFESKYCARLNVESFKW